MASKLKISAWDNEKARQELLKRRRNASEAREEQEKKWRQNELTIFGTASSGTPELSVSPLLGDISADLGQGSARMNVAYVFKNFRFIHAQMSSNPPSVVMRPATADQEDHSKADAADKIARHSLRKYLLQEKIDQLTLQTLARGIGVVKTRWDATIGEIINFDKTTGEIDLEGDMSITTPDMWNIRIDPDATSIADIKWVIEDLYLDFDEALSRWPDKEEELNTARVNASKGGDSNSGIFGSKRPGSQGAKGYNTVHLMEYWETGLPTNGYLGRYCVSTVTGDILEPCTASPFKFKRPGAIATLLKNTNISDEERDKLIEKLPEQARLPFHFLTDIDLLNSVYGASCVEFAANLQENLNSLDSAVLDNIQAHGVARLIIPESAELNSEMSNNPWDITKITGNQGPWFQEVPQLMPEMTTTRINLITGITDSMGLNESMFGQQSREQAAAAMQYATNQGNMVRRRLFNKYVLVVESIYRAILDLARKHWTVERTISVTGKEKALEAGKFKGTDIDGGYDVVGEYGVSLSLDPITRRQEILMMQPLFKEAGIPTRTVLRFMKLSELESIYDEMQLAESRQKEIFELMIVDGQYRAPEDLMDHANMMQYAFKYFMTSEFNMLEKDLQELCKQHIRERAQLAAAERSGMMGAGADVPPELEEGQVGVPPVTAGSPEEASQELPPPGA